MKYLFIELVIQDGERRHTHRILHTTPGQDINFAAQRYACTYWGYGEREDDHWSVDSGQITVRVAAVREISEYEYQVMQDIFSGNVRQDYFKIVATGWNQDIQREEIQVHAGENGNVFIIKTEEGFIVDVYGQEDVVDTMAIWEDDLSEE